MQSLGCSSCGKEPNSFLAAIHLGAVVRQLLTALALCAVFNKPDLGAHQII